MPNNRHDGIGKLNRREDICADTNMEFHLLELGRCQRAWFIENVLGYGQLAHVVEESCCLDRSNLCVIRNTHHFSETNRVGLDASNMPMSYLVLCVDRHCESFDSRHVEGI